MSCRAITVDRKRFTVDIDNRYRGKRVKITETTRDKSFFLSIHWSSLTWITCCFDSLLHLPINQRFFKETRIDEQTLWVEKTTNRKGTLAEIAKLDINGGINKILVPVGDNRKGWLSFINLLKDFNVKTPTQSIPDPPTKTTHLLPSNNQQQTKHPLSFCEVLKKKREEPQKECSRPAIKPQTYPHADTNLDTSIIVFRKHFHDDWYKIMRALQVHVCHFCTVNPFLQTGLFSNVKIRNKLELSHPSRTGTKWVLSN